MAMTICNQDATASVNRAQTLFSNRQHFQSFAADRVECNRCTYFAWRLLSVTVACYTSQEVQSNGNISCSWRSLSRLRLLTVDSRFHRSIIAQRSVASLAMMYNSARWFRTAEPLLLVESPSAARAYRKRT